MPCGVSPGHESWTSEAVANWLHTNELGHVAGMFLAHRITGDILLDLTSKDLVEVGVQALGDRKRFLRAVAQLRPPSNLPIVCQSQFDVHPEQAYHLLSTPNWCV